MTDLRTSATTEAEWARALYQALLRVEPTPIYEQVVREYGRPVLVAS